MSLAGVASPFGVGAGTSAAAERGGAGGGCGPRSEQSSSSSSSSSLLLYSEVGLSDATRAYHLMGGDPGVSVLEAVHFG
jgi:hypothetical protein